jgi:hypothetical protein
MSRGTLSPVLYSRKAHFTIRILNQINNGIIRGKIASPKIEEINPKRKGILQTT